MIVILDTNVVMSAIFFSKTLKPVLEHWAAGKYSIAMTKEIAEEYIDIYERLSKKYEPLAESILKAVLAKSAYYEPVALPGQVCEDPDDDMFLACALSCSAGYLVTGDKLLLAVREIGKTAIVTPKVFLAKF
jgi:uncharacterized protein